MFELMLEGMDGKPEKDVSDVGLASTDEHRDMLKFLETEESSSNSFGCR